MYRIVKKEALKPTVTLYEIEAPMVAKKAEPGQFIILRVDENGERIPITIHDFDREKGTVTIIVQTIGATTEKLRHKAEGEYIQDFVGPLDVLVLCSECIRPLSLVECYPIGVISMEDSGSLDEKIIAIPFQDPTYNTYQDISELPNHVASEIRHFFRVYKSLEGKETVVSDVLGREEAIKIIIKCQNAYIEKYCR